MKYIIYDLETEKETIAYSLDDASKKMGTSLAHLQKQMKERTYHLFKSLKMELWEYESFLKSRGYIKRDRYLTLLEKASEILRKNEVDEDVIHKVNNLNYYLLGD